MALISQMRKKQMPILQHDFAINSSRTWKGKKMQHFHHVNKAVHDFGK